MRIATWNAGKGRAEEKVAYLVKRLRPNVVAIQEIARPPDDVKLNACWFGKNENCGVLVWARPPLRVKQLELKCRTEIYHPVRVLVGMRVVCDIFNVWAKRFEARPQGWCAYRYSLQTGLKAGLLLPGRAPRVFLGDFNTVNVESKEEYINWLGESGFFSAYHAFRGEWPGREEYPTHLHRPSGTKHHIDFCFLPHQWRPAVKKVSVGAAKEWSKWSDHFPLLVDLDDRIMENTREARKN